MLICSDVCIQLGICHLKPFVFPLTIVLIEKREAAFSAWLENHSQAVPRAASDLILEDEFG